MKNVGDIAMLIIEEIDRSCLFSKHVWHVEEYRSITRPVKKCPTLANASQRWRDAIHVAKIQTLKQVDHWQARHA